MFGDPHLLADGYHLGDGSAAIDAGVNVGIVQDIDGDARPSGAGYDIGAGECRIASTCRWCGAAPERREQAAHSSAEGRG